MRSAKTQANRGPFPTTEVASMLKSHNNQTLPAKSPLFQQTKVLHIRPTTIFSQGHILPRGDLGETDILNS